MKYQPGQTITPTRLPTVDGGSIDVPHPHQLTHLYFSRWAGCPICNMHIASYRRRATAVLMAKASPFDRRRERGFARDMVADMAPRVLPAFVPFYDPRRVLASPGMSEALERYPEAA